MIVYKVFYKNLELKKGKFIGALIERRKDLRGTNLFDAGLRWAKLTFGHLVKDKQGIFVVPDELNFGNDNRLLVEKGIFTKEEFLEIVKVVDRGMKRERKWEDC